MNLLIYCTLAAGLVFTVLVLTIFFNNRYLKKQAGLLSYRAERKQAFFNKTTDYFIVSSVIEGYNQDMATPKFQPVLLRSNATKAAL